jgi:hypothetical protein
MTANAGSLSEVLHSNRVLAQPGYIMTRLDILALTTKTHIMFYDTVVLVVTAERNRHRRQILLITRLVSGDSDRITGQPEVRHMERVLREYGNAI